MTNELCWTFTCPGASDDIVLNSDVPTKEFILSLNAAKQNKDKFVIEDLDETRLFVQPTVVEWLEARLKEFHDENTYQAPRRDMQQ
jgi:hypothetical protein